ncbi:MAG: E3 binding domain-containing protein, partial [Halioglobus sp.]|nr:E3 binding domain-containing protein [Halioglobus sp.]
MAIEKIIVPDIGGAEGAEVIEVLVTPGDEVIVDQGLIVLESDKASMEIPTTIAGKVIELLAAVGDELAEGAPVAMIERVPDSATAATPTEQEPAADVPRQAAQDAPVDASPAAAQVPTDSDSPAVESVREAEAAAPTVGVGAAPQAPVTGTKFYAGPAVRKLAREFGIPLEQVHGSGPQGRILKEDLHRYSRRSLQEGGGSGGAGLPQVPEIDFSRFGEV